VAVGFVTKVPLLGGTSAAFVGIETGVEALVEVEVAVLTWKTGLAPSLGGTTSPVGIETGMEALAGVAVLASKTGSAKSLDPARGSTEVFELAVSTGLATVVLLSELDGPKMSFCAPGIGSVGGPAAMRNHQSLTISKATLLVIPGRRARGDLHIVAR